MQQPTVLIVSDDPSFSSAVTGRWQSEREMPAFTLMGSDLCHALDPETFDLAIVAGSRSRGVTALQKALAGKPAVFVLEENCPAQQLREARACGAALRKHEDWLETLVLLGSEILRRTEATTRAEQAEQAGAVAAVEATLGRYMLEARHNLNNALTSVLGNSELMLEPGILSSVARSQAETIHNMALRMHETLQRFSSLEKELRAAGKESKGRAVAASRT
ncbi:MAG TPA: hypothetical protein VMH85_03490 [Terriglobales bacterium]|nr:hypothetical protein [Terriglobales bacterium]